ncbi:hypothetical protein COCC4DRAFT_197787 [Bipolaris maydis ATCC 48331]|uniref:Uncharacterized protein n=2 Tax=Cochliobolus heterostrophus TaxID=5016 RepID=M2VBE8_COCH5|nr:uncharacterized protein COCC4DRAFT_197787 [Bipolaris maydis ATCC 48331]EMD97262.1 hypothetical protein COCHEDRAFT_1163938 [Bipolaris maydis C5]KAJ5061549.1 hypothetical protein J3E74DRAFT_448874 [Bipolaris maydis]ENI04277.1 hypothetical protein COCC4DRAFT_197787 [Bipolaris maydis ATCC 48331]KAJ6214512.1 hypothetical protein PSV09DRAFT_1163938 [Bipolaris maydis]KAJ6275689.1 hypothetical protein PSV08DRAFT_397919 [Bipolaris maydis]
MDRIDSGFAGSQHSNMASEKPVLLHRSNTTSIHQRKSKKSALESTSSSVQVANMETRRPVSEQRSRPLRQQSTTSSENSTNRSKSRGHGSKPSSRRTSCTIVDPSRPARHYRVKSFQTPPTADIDDVLALHFRSCSIFSNPSYQSHSGLPSPTLSHGDAFGFPSNTSTTRFSTDTLRVVQESDAHHTRPTTEPTPLNDDATSAAAKKTNTTMHWTSPCTRQREYQRIDKANSGLRGFLRRITPRCVSGPQEKFYSKTDEDAGSVRRYRISNDEYEEDDGKEADFDLQAIKEKQHQGARPRTSPVPRPASRPGIRKRWTCF